MSVTRRPLVPRPTSTTKPAPRRAIVTVGPASPRVQRLSPAAALRKTYDTWPPVLRDTLPNIDVVVELVDDDIVEAKPAAVPARRASASSAPPPPAVRSMVVRRTAAIAVPKIATLRLPDFDALPLPAASWNAAPLPASLHPRKIAATTATAPSPASRENTAQQVHSEPVPASGVVARASAEPARARLESLVDPTDVLFDGMYALEFVESAWQAASVCAAALARALGARAVIVHSHDLEQHELRAIGVYGDPSGELLGSSGDSDDDLVASAVICNEKAVTMQFDGELPRLAPRRFDLLGAPRTLVAVPAMSWGRCVAVIEILDADERFAGRVADSAAYVAERLAAYLSGRRAA